MGCSSEAKEFISNPIDYVEREVIRPIGGAVENVVESIIQNPIPVITTIALTSMGIPAPVASAAVSAANGAPVEDIIKAGVSSYLSPEIAQNVGPYAAELTGSIEVGKVIASAAGAAGGAAIAGGDIGAAAASGALGSIARQTYDAVTQQAPAPIETVAPSGIPIGAPAAPTIEQLYQSVLGRAPDPEGLAYWSGYQGDPTAAFIAAAQGERPGATYSPLERQIAETAESIRTTPTAPGTQVAAGPSAVSDVPSITGLPPGTKTVPVSELGATQLSPADTEARAIFGEGTGTEKVGVTEATRLPFFEPGELDYLSSLQAGGGRPGGTRPVGTTGAGQTFSVQPGPTNIPSVTDFGGYRPGVSNIQIDSSRTGFPGTGQPGTYGTTYGPFQGVSGTTQGVIGGGGISGVGPGAGPGGEGPGGAGDGEVGGDGEGDGFTSEYFPSPDIDITDEEKDPDKVTYPIDRFPLPSGTTTLIGTRLFTPDRTSLAGLAPVERRRRTELTDEEGEPTGRWGSETLRGLLGI